MARALASPSEPSPGIEAGPKRLLPGRSFPWPGGLWARLSLPLLAGILPLLALLFVAVSADGSRVVLNAQAQAVEAARLGAAQQHAMLQEAVSLLHVLAHVPALAAGGASCNAFLASISSEVMQLAAISVADASGVIACSTRTQSLGLNIAGRSYFAEAMTLQKGAPYALSELVSSRLDGKPTMFIGVPLQLTPASSIPPGVVVAVLNLTWFDTLWHHVPGAGRQVLQVLDSRDGAVLARAPDDSRFTGLRFPESALVKAARASPLGGTITTPDLDGEERFFAFAPLPGPSPGLLIAASLPGDLIRSGTEWRVTRAMGLGIGVAALAIALSWILAQQTLVRPLRALSSAVVRLGSGDMSSAADIPDGGAWELRALAATFSRMARRLQLRDSRIEAMQIELAASEGHHRLLADAANDMITRFSSELRRIYVSPACRDILGYEPEELVGNMPGSIVHPEDWDDLNTKLNGRLLAGHPTARATYRAFRKDGVEIWVESSGRSLGDGEGFVVVTRDVTERKALEQQLATANSQLRVLVQQDALTGLANRRRFDEALDEEYRRLLRAASPLAVIMLDVDCFKLFNDTYGHPAGDACLKAVAGAIDQAKRRPGDLTARYGGEEFAILLPDTDHAGAMYVADRVQAAIRAAALPHSASSRGIVTVSMGIAITLPCEGDGGPAALVEQADAALYCAKRAGRDTIHSVTAPPGAELTKL